jgi:hypothetical protein
MDETQAAETEAEETREEESGDPAEEEEAQEQQQEVEEHDWGEVEQLREQFSAMQDELAAVKEALATISIGREDVDTDSEPEDFGEDGEALDLDSMLGL